MTKEKSKKKRKFKLGGIIFIILILYLLFSFVFYLYKLPIKHIDIINNYYITDDYIIDLLINVYLYKLNNNDTNITKFNINYNNIILDLIKNQKTDLNTKK